MINYKEEFKEMQKQFRDKLSNAESIKTGVNIHFINFESEFNPSTSDQDLDHQLELDLTQINSPENIYFKIPIIAPETKEPFSKAILLLHGLNERSWDKYLVWAKYLSQKTNKPVILFPIAFHMNRSPKEWSNPRIMGDIAKQRKEIPNNDRSTFANAALSTRLEAKPEQLFVSGVQSYFDIVQLINELRAGKHPLFQNDFQFDIFSYSIGSFLSEILLLNNPQNLFSNTRLFMFCGGSTFDFMKGASKLIMDKIAYIRLSTFHQKSSIKRLYQSLLKLKIDGFAELWLGLKAMLSINDEKEFRERRLQEIGKRIYAMTLRFDQVIPAAGILSTLGFNNSIVPATVEVIDFPYAYSHEQPFPWIEGTEGAEVDQCFCMVFDKATQFLH